MEGGMAMANPDDRGVATSVGTQSARLISQRTALDEKPLLRTATLRLSTEAILVLAGELDLSSGEQVREAALECLADPPEHLSVDLSAIEFCDCAGLRILEWVRLKAEAVGAGFSLLGVRPRTRRLLTMGRAEELLAACDMTAPVEEGQRTRIPR
jgi:anti-sigma B factor antagonist